MSMIELTAILIASIGASSSIFFGYMLYSFRHQPKSVEDYDKALKPILDKISGFETELSEVKTAQAELNVKFKLSPEPKTNGNGKKKNGDNHKEEKAKT